MDVLSGYGYPGLFISAFLAATLLPLSSEVVLALLLKQGLNPAGCLMAATAGNVLGSVLNYGMGAFGSRLILNKIWRMADADIRRAEQRFRAWGIFSLLLAWVPVIGDPITVVAGALRVPFGLFLLLVSLGKGLRYAVIWLAVLSI